MLHKHVSHFPAVVLEVRECSMTTTVNTRVNIVLIQRSYHQHHQLPISWT